MKLFEIESGGKAVPGWKINGESGRLPAVEVGEGGIRKYSLIRLPILSATGHKPEKVGVKCPGTNYVWVAPNSERPTTPCDCGALPSLWKPDQSCACDNCKAAYEAAASASLPDPRPVCGSGHWLAEHNEVPGYAMPTYPGILKDRVYSGNLVRMFGGGWGIVPTDPKTDQSTGAGVVIRNQAGHKGRWTIEGMRLQTCRNSWKMSVTEGQQCTECGWRPDPAHNSEVGKKPCPIRGQVGTETSRMNLFCLVCGTLPAFRPAMVEGVPTFVHTETGEVGAYQHPPIGVYGDTPEFKVAGRCLGGGQEVMVTLSAGGGFVVSRTGALKSGIAEYQVSWDGKRPYISPLAQVISEQDGLMQALLNCVLAS
jgi:hypothetical protein